MRRIRGTFLPFLEHQFHSIPTAIAAMGQSPRSERAAWASDRIRGRQIVEVGFTDAEVWLALEDHQILRVSARPNHVHWDVDLPGTTGLPAHPAKDSDAFIEMECLDSESQAMLHVFERKRLLDSILGKRASSIFTGVKLMNLYIEGHDSLEFDVFAVEPDGRPFLFWEFED